MEQIGKTKWIIPDGYISSKSGSQTSHDAVCVLNLCGKEAKITLTLYFEDRDPIVFKSACPAERTHHIRMDKITDKNGNFVPRDTPYAILVESSCPIVAQYSRLDTSASDTALMTTIAFPV